MQQFGFLLVLVSASTLVGLVAGLRFNVRLLVWLCLGAIAFGGVASFVPAVGIERPLTATLTAVGALQLGYFVAVVIQAMRIDEQPRSLATEEATAAPVDTVPLPPRA